MIVLICGDRNWDNKTVIVNALKDLPKNTVVLEGGCRGADLLAKDVATDLGLTVLEFPAQWDVHGKAAGPIRNSEMLSYVDMAGNKVELVMAFHANISKSKGTADVVRKATAKGIKVSIFKT